MYATVSEDLKHSQSVILCTAGFQARSGGGGVELDRPSSYPRRGHEQGGRAGLRKLDFFRFEFFLTSSAADIVLVTLPSRTAAETAIAQCTSRSAKARGHHLNTSIVLAAVHGLSGLFRAVSAVEPSLFRPPPVPVPDKPSRFCERKAKCTRTLILRVSRFGLAVRR